MTPRRPLVSLPAALVAALVASAGLAAEPVRKPAPANETPAPAAAKPAPSEATPPEVPAAATPPAESPAVRPAALVKSKHPVFSTTMMGTPVGVEARAQARVRGEFIGPRDLSGNNPTLPIFHRIRLGTTFAMGDHLRILAEFQDVRTWGDELPLVGKPQDPTLFGYSAGGIDLHQGYVAGTFAGFDLRIGRQEISLDGQRLIGAVDWTMQGRSFDGARVVFDQGGHTATGFAAIVRNADTSPADAPFAHKGIAGVHYKFAWQKYLAIAPLLLLDYQGPFDKLRATTGARANGTVFGFGYDLEGYYQGSWNEGVITHAALVAARVGYGFEYFVKARFELFGDFVSGDTDREGAGGLSPFDTLYATNHKFYGFQDLFLNLPVNSGGRGLFDAGATAKVSGGLFSARVDVHVMTAADLMADPLYGVEPDFILGLKLLDGLSVQGGASAFVPIGPGLGRGNAITPWTYIQVVSAI